MPDSTFSTPTDLTHWRNKLTSSAKSPVSMDQLQWQVSDYFQLDPVYDQSSLGEEYRYLQSFHNQWKTLRPEWKPRFKASGLLLENGIDWFSEAEGYGFSEWVVDKGVVPNPVRKLPVEYRLLDAKPVPDSPHCCYDPIMDSLLLGNWTQSYQHFKEVKATLPFHIHASDVHHAGGSAVSELAFCLLVAEQYRKGISPEVFNTTCSDWVLHLAAGPSFWLETGKIRAMRLLWMNFCAVNGAPANVGNLEVATSKVYWSKTDPDGNLLRHTSEVMSALIAGADSILIQPHSFDPATALDATRQAINIGLLATKEAHSDRFLDPASGSYLVEILTHKLSEAAWKLFSEWNERPFEEAIVAGEFQNTIQKHAGKLRSAFAEGTLWMVGVNHHTSDMARTSPPFPTLKVNARPSFQALNPLFLDA